MARTSAPKRNTNLRNRAGNGRGRRIQIEARPWWRRKRILWTLFGILSFLLIINALFVSGWVDTRLNRMANSFYKSSAEFGLKVEEIYVTGRTQAQSSDIMAALNIEREQPILSIDLKEAHDALVQLPWVQSARIERHLPNVIYVDITERKPYARWQYQQQTSLIDKEGIVLAQSDVDRFSALPLVVGSGANKHAAEILDEIQAVPAFASTMKAAIRVSDRRWDLRLNNGMTLRLPENGMAEALQRLNNMWRTTDIASRNVRVIDARLPDRVIIDEHKPDAAKEGKDGSSETAEAPL